MKYQPPFGSLDPNAPYVDRNTLGAVAGSRVPAAAVEHTQREMHNTIVKSDLTPSPDDLTQLAQAIRSQRLNYVVAGGTADALTASLDPAPTAMSELTGMPLRVAVSAANTGPTTLQIGDMPAQPIVRADNGAPLLGENWQPGTILDLLNDGSAWRLVSPQARDKPPALLFYGCL